MTDRITAYINNTTLAPSDSVLSLTTPRRVVTWQDTAGAVNITGGTPVAYAARGELQVQLEATILDAAAGEVLVTWDAGDLTAGNWSIEHRLTLGGIVSGVRWVDNVVESFFVPPTGEPVVTGAGTITLTGTGPVTATFAAPTKTGTEPITVTLAATRDGGDLSVTGSDGNGTATIAKTASAQTVSAVWTLDGPVGDPVVTDAVTVTVPAYTVPAAALAPTLTPTGATSLTATLAADEADGGSAITDRTLVYTVNAGAEVSVTGLAAEATHSITGLTAGDTVVARVDVTTAAGTTEGATATAETWLLPEAPVAGTLVGAVGAVVYTWPATPELNGRSLVREDYILYDDTDTQIGTGQRVGGEATTTISATAGAGRYIRSNAVTDAGAGPLSPASNAVTVLTGASASIAAFTRDQVVFDTGAAVDANAVSVPLPDITTDADDGAWIRARAVRADTGIEVYGWRRVGQAASGALTGAVLTEETGARNANWLRVQVDVEDSAASPGAMANRFAAGHVIDLWGQSELHRAVLSATGAVTGRATISDDDALQVSYCDATGAGWGNPANFRHQFITDADSHSGHLNDLSNLFAAERPGEKFHVVFQTLSGTGVRNLLAVANPELRPWASDMALRDWALADGQETGLAVPDWAADDAGTLNSDYGPFWAKAISGLMPDGVTASDLTYNFSDIYDYSRTRFAIAGPHRYELNSFDATIPQVRASLRDVFASDARLTNRAIRALEPLSYLNGAANGSDVSHPNAGSVDGYNRLFVQIGHAILQGLGFGYATPAFDSATLAAGSAYVEVWSSAGNVLTARTNRAETQPTGFPQVYGFRWNGTIPAARADIVSGRVRVYWNADGDPIPDGSILTFGSDSMGTETLPDDLTPNAIWKDHPLVDLGQAGIEGLPISGLTPAAVLDVIPAASAPAGYDQTLSIAPDGSSFREGIVNTFQAGGGWVNDTGAAGTFWPDGTSSDETIQFDCSDNGKVRAVLNSDAWTTSPIGVATTLKFYVTGSGAGTLGVEAVAAGNGGGVDVWGTVSVDLSTDKGTLITISGTPNAARARIEVNFQMSVLGSGTLTIHTPVMEV